MDPRQSNGVPIDVILVLLAGGWVLSLHLHQIIYLTKHISFSSLKQRCGRLVVILGKLTFPPITFSSLFCFF